MYINLCGYKGYELTRKIFDGKEFSSLMAKNIISCSGVKELFVVYKDGGHYFTVKDKGDLVLETISLRAAIQKFNELCK